MSEETQDIMDQVEEENQDLQVVNPLDGIPAGEQPEEETDGTEAEEVEVEGEDSEVEPASSSARKQEEIEEERRKANYEEYEQKLATLRESSEMTSTSRWQQIYKNMVQEIKSAKTAMVDCKGSELPYWQARVKCIREIIMDEVEKVEIFNSFIKENSLFVPKRDALSGAHFDFDHGQVLIIDFENASDLIGKYEFPHY